MTTKIHAVVDGSGNPLKLHLSGGNVHDIVPVCELITGLKADMMIADRAYDADRFIIVAEKQDMIVVIPPKSNRSVQRQLDRHIHKEQHLVECFFTKIIAFRRITTHYDKLAVSLQSRRPHRRLYGLATVIILRQT